MTFVNNIQTNIFSRGSFDSISFKRMHKKIKMRLDLRIDCDDRMLKNRIKEFYFYKSNYHNKKIWLFIVR